MLIRRPILINLMYMLIMFAVCMIFLIVFERNILLYRLCYVPVVVDELIMAFYNILLNSGQDDNTDGLERVFIQWNYSFFFPTITLCNHVTNWRKQSLKFRTDVAMMGKLGYDLVVSKLNENELKFSQQVLRDYARLKSIIWHGRLFRLVSPYRLNRDIASLLYVNEERDQAVWFTYLVGNRYLAGSNGVIRLKGLDPLKKYQIQEINIYPGTDQSTVISVQSISGDYLMTYGFNPVVDVQRPSVVLQLTNVTN